MPEIIARKHNQKIGVIAAVSCAEVQTKSPIELEVALTEHVTDCRYCLAMVLFREETLAEVGCPEYKSLLAKALTVCPTITAPLSTTDHIGDDILDEYCFDRLSPNERARLDKHLKSCLGCAKNLEQRLAFIRNMKTALALLAERETSSGGMYDYSSPSRSTKAGLCGN